MDAIIKWGILFLLLLIHLGWATEPNITIQYNQVTEPNCIYLFAHGLGACQKQGIDYFKNPLMPHWILNEPLVLFDFPDAKTKEGEYHNKLVNLGQQSDIERLVYACNESINRFPNKRIVLGGLSRGAVTILNLVASVENAFPIAALILESPFDTLKSVVVHLINRYKMHWFPYARQLGFKIAQKHFPSLNLNGIFPFQVIDRTPPQIPIIFIHSKKDKVIPINSSRKLYAKLLMAGHNDVYLLELNHGGHGKLLESPDGAIYRNTVHAFYKKYNLPHDPCLAQQGESYLIKPSLQDVMLRLQKKRSMDLCDEDDE